MGEGSRGDASLIRPERNLFLRTVGPPDEVMAVVVEYYMAAPQIEI